MSSNTLRLTQFKVQRLQCIGGQGRVAPYHITTYEGSTLGTFGEIVDPACAAGNMDTFERPAVRCLKRLLPGRG